MDTGISIVNPNLLLLQDAVSASAVEWGLIGHRLLSAMSGSDAPPRPWLETQHTALTSSSAPAKAPAEAPSEEDTGLDTCGRRKLKNEDSSYDSDFDGACESVTSPRGDAGEEEDAHEDVSRTASETLWAEFEDYVTHHQVLSRPGPPGFTTILDPTGAPGVSPLPPSTRHVAPVSHVVVSSPPTLTVTDATPQPVASLGSAPTFRFPPGDGAEQTPIPSAPPRPLSAVVESTEYPQQVEFGVKLGYSESLVQLALTKLGLNPDNNELLNELIRLGAGAPRSDCEEDPAEGEDVEQPALRQVIIDGSNVAMSHGNKVKFSCKGIRLCVDWFRARGHKEILVFVPMWRKEQSRLDAIITDQDVLQELEKEGVLSFTPSRSCGGKRIVSYDDRYIIKEAHKSDGVIVSNDNYRDLLNESPAFRKVIETSLLMYSWVNGRFEPPDDPLGRNGPSLDVFLRKPVMSAVMSLTAKDSRLCPYGRKCTYGNKCKYMHPERGPAPVKSVTEMLQEQKQKHYQDKAKSRDSSPGECLRHKSLSLPVTASETSGTKKPLTRTQSTFPTISLCSPAALSKEGSILQYPSALVSSASDTSSTTVHTTVTPQGSVDSLCESFLKGDSLFNLCPSQLNLRPSLSWQSQEGNQTAQIPPSLSFNPHVSEHDRCAENLHPKLERQLSLNPVGDDRLSKMSKQYMGNPSGDYATLMSLSQQQKQILPQLLQPLPTQHPSSQQATPHQPSQPHHRLLESEVISNRSCIGTRCISPAPAFSHGYAGREMMPAYLHSPLTRHSSQDAKTPLQPSFSQHILSPCFHNPVVRNLSAPDPIRGGGQQQHQNIIPHITRLNSTSDSRLNVHGSAADSHQVAPECFDDLSLSCLPYTPLPLTSRTNNSPGPIGSSRPLSPQQQQSLTGLIPPSLPSSPRIPTHHSQTAASMAGPLHGLAPSSNSGSSNTHEDERLKIFYHLSQLFPEAQVRAALARNPDETDPTKICVSILSMSGCRPVSPTQVATGGVAPVGSAPVAHPSLAPSNLPLRNPGFGGHFAPGSGATHDTTREGARMDAYSKLSQLFPKEQVRNILLRYPEETEPIKLCMLLMAATSQS